MKFGGLEIDRVTVTARSRVLRAEYTVDLNDKETTPRYDYVFRKGLWRAMAFPMPITIPEGTRVFYFRRDDPTTREWRWDWINRDYHEVLPPMETWRICTWAITEPAARRIPEALGRGFKVFYAHVDPENLSGDYFIIAFKEAS